MRNRSLTLVSVGVVILLVVVATAAMSRLPAGTQLPVHWNNVGEADCFANAASALFMPAALTVGVSLLFTILPRIEPLQEGMSRSAPLLESCWIGLLLFRILLEAVIAAPAFKLAVPAALPAAALGVLLIIIGNALPKSRPNFFVGIRTPWTLTDADNWIATHRLGSRTMIAGGATIVLSALLPINADQRAIVVCLALASAILPPLIYSYWFWRNRTRA